MQKPRRQRTSVFLNPEHLAGLKQLKERDGISESEAIRRAIAEFLERRGIEVQKAHSRKRSWARSAAVTCRAAFYGHSAHSGETEMTDYIAFVNDIVEEVVLAAIREVHPCKSAAWQAREAKRQMAELTMDEVSAILEELAWASSLAAFTILVFSERVE
jgi:hypothetical protein